MYLILEKGYRDVIDDDFLGRRRREELYPILVLGMGLGMMLFL